MGVILPCPPISASPLFQPWVCVRLRGSGPALFVFSPRKEHTHPWFIFPDKSTDVRIPHSRVVQDMPSLQRLLQVAEQILCIFLNMDYLSDDVLGILVFWVCVL